MANDVKLRRFSVYNVIFILLLAAAGIILASIGIRRVILNMVGGGTVLILGAVLVLSSLLIALGIATTRTDKISKRYHDLTQLIGKKGLVKERIPAGGKGVILVDNELWTAMSDQEIEKGMQVIIINIEGIFLVVRRLD